jgi:hypothetical protein
LDSISALDFCKVEPSVLKMVVWIRNPVENPHDRGERDRKEAIVMPAIVDYPAVVKEALDVFGSSFANEPERRHFAECLTGLILAQKRNVSANNREFAVTTDQSCLNRWLTEAVWDE